MIRVLIADGDSHVRSGLRTALEATDGVEVAGEAADAVRAVEAAKEYRPDVVIIDSSFPHHGGVEATRRLSALGATPRVLAMTAPNPDGTVLDVLRAGASGFFVQDISAEELARAVRIVAAGGTVFEPRVLEALTRGRHGAGSDGLPEKVGHLSDSERQILACIGAGRNNQQIADECRLSITMVKTHVARLLQRLELEHPIQAAILAHEAGVVTRT